MTDNFRDSVKAEKPLVLVIEDDDALRPSYELKLKVMNNVDVVAVEDHEQAREWLASGERQPDLVLSDNDTFLGTDGLVWLKEIADQQVPFKVVMATGGEEGLEQGKKLIEEGHPHLAAVLSKTDMGAIFDQMKKQIDAIKGHGQGPGAPG